MAVAPEVIHLLGVSCRVGLGHGEAIRVTRDVGKVTCRLCLHSHQSKLGQSVEMLGQEQRKAEGQRLFALKRIEQLGREC